MPSKSAKQHRLMEMVAHNPKMAKKVGIPQSVGKDFVEADKGKHFRKGGDMPINPNAVRAMKMAARRPAPTVAATPMMGAQMPGAAPMGMKHGGLSKEHHKTLAHHHLAMAEHHLHMHKGGTKKMAHGGPVEDPEIEAGEKHLKHGEHAVQKRGHTRALEEKMKGNDVGNYKHGGKAHVKKMATGGHVKETHMKHVEAGGHLKHGEHPVQKKGHTKAMQPKMKGRMI